MKLGFIGCGNMASAIIGGILNKGLAQPEDICASVKTQSSAQKFKIHWEFPVLQIILKLQNCGLSLSCSQASILYRCSSSD